MRPHPTALVAGPTQVPQCFSGSCPEHGHNALAQGSASWGPRRAGEVEGPCRTLPSIPWGLWPAQHCPMESKPCGAQGWPSTAPWGPEQVPHGVQVDQHCPVGSEAGPALPRGVQAGPALPQGVQAGPALSRGVQAPSTAGWGLRPAKSRLHRGVRGVLCPWEPASTPCLIAPAHSLSH